MNRYPIHPYIVFKTPEVAERTKYLCDTAMEVLYEMAEYAEERKLPFVVTDSVTTPTEDKALDRVSDEHSTARAFDISIHGWIDLAITAFKTYFTQRFISVAATSKKTGEPRLIYDEPHGTGPHIHVQVSRTYALANPLGLPTDKMKA